MLASFTAQNDEQVWDRLKEGAYCIIIWLKTEEKPILRVLVEVVLEVMDGQQSTGWHCIHRAPGAFNPELPLAQRRLMPEEWAHLRAQQRARPNRVVESTKIIEDYRSKIFRFFLARNLPNLRQEPPSLVSTSLTHSGDDEDSEDSGIISLFFCWNLRNLPAESSSEMPASFTASEAGNGRSVCEDSG